MGIPAKNGIYDFRRGAQKCNRTCKEYENCTVRLDPFGKCAKHDRPEYYVKYVRITNADGTVRQKEIYGNDDAENDKKGQ